MAIKLTNFDIIKGPMISDKAHKLNQRNNQLVLRVHLKANKPLIKKAIEKLFEVKVKDVRTMIRKKSRVRATQKRYNAKPAPEKFKIAHVTLAEGHSLNLFDQAGAPSVKGEQQTKTGR